VKQSDLGEYEENTREKQNIQYTRQKHQLPLKPSHMNGKHKFSKLKRVVTKPWGFSMQKSILPLKPRLIRSSVKLNKKTPTPPEVENLRFYQMSLDKPQGKHRPLKQQRKSKCIWPRHKSHKSENSHQRSQANPTCHPQQEKYGSQGQLISKQGQRPTN
jgi:hypothetical protein